MNSQIRQRFTYLTIPNPRLPPLFGEQIHSNELASILLSGRELHNYVSVRRGKEQGREGEKETGSKGEHTV